MGLPAGATDPDGATVPKVIAGVGPARRLLGWAVGLEVLVEGAVVGFTFTAGSLLGACCGNS